VRSEKFAVEIFRATTTTTDDDDDDKGHGGMHAGTAWPTPTTPKYGGGRGKGSQGEREAPSCLRLPEACKAGGAPWFPPLITGLALIGTRYFCAGFETNKRCK